MRLLAGNLMGIAPRHFKSRVQAVSGDSTLIDPLPFWKKVPRKLYSPKSIVLSIAAFMLEKQQEVFPGRHEKPVELCPHAVDNDYFMRDERGKNGDGCSEAARIGN